MRNGKNAVLGRISANGVDNGEIWDMRKQPTCIHAMPEKAKAIIHKPTEK